jgi:putative membrane protein
MYLKRPCWFCVVFFVGGASLALSAKVAQSNERDHKFIRSVAIADMTEAHMAEMAQNTASASAVKDFGVTLDREALDEYGQLSALAGKTGAVIPKGIKAATTPSIQLLTRKKGSEFDKNFLRSEIADEQKLISTLDSEAMHGSNADIKAWAEKTATARRQQLEKARALVK